MRLFPYSCEVISYTEGTITDDYGNPQVTRGTIDTVCDYQQVRTTEPALAGESSITTWDFFFPTGTVIDTASRVVVDGATYELVGDPWDANQGSNAVNHIEATAVRQGAGT